MNITNFNVCTLSSDSPNVKQKIVLQERPIWHSKCIDVIVQKFNFVAVFQTYKFFAFVCSCSTIIITSSIIRLPGGRCPLHTNTTEDWRETRECDGHDNSVLFQERKGIFRQYQIYHRQVREIILNRIQNLLSAFRKSC